MPTLAGRLKNALRPPPRAAHDDLSEPDESASANRRKKRKKKIMHAIPVVLEETMDLLNESSDFCPPLKSAVGGLSHIVAIVKTMNGNKEDAQRLFQKADSLLSLLSDNIPDCTKIHPDMLKAVVSELARVCQEADQLPKKHPVVRFFKTKSEGDELRVLREQLDDAVTHFMLASVVRAALNHPTIADQTNTSYSGQSMQISPAALPHADIQKLISCLIASSFNTLY